MNESYCHWDKEPSLFNRFEFKSNVARKENEASKRFSIFDLIAFHKNFPVKFSVNVIWLGTDCWSPFAISNYHDVNFDIDSTCNHSIVKVNIYDFIRWEAKYDLCTLHACCIHFFNDKLSLCIIIYIVLLLHSKGRRNFEYSKFTLKSWSNFAGCRFILECLLCAPMQITICRFELCVTA